MGPTPGVLQEVNIPIWSNSECKSKYGPAAPGGIVDSFLCAGKDWMDSCSVSKKMLHIISKPSTSNFKLVIDNKKQITTICLKNMNRRLVNP